MFFKIANQEIKFGLGEAIMAGLGFVLIGSGLFFLQTEPVYSIIMIGLGTFTNLFQLLPHKYEKKADEWIYKKLGVKRINE